LFCAYLFFTFALHYYVNPNNMKKTYAILFSLVAVLFAPSAGGQNFTTVTENNNGQTITLSTGQILEIRLPRKASTGYIWCESKTSADKKNQRTVAQVGDDDFINDPNPLTIEGKVLAGQSGTQVMRYAGTSAGTTEFAFELRRPWEKDAPAIDNYSVTVVSEGKYTGNYTAPVKEKPVHVTSTPKDLPSHFDWRPSCTPITDQQQCGDCWAFAGVGTLECNIKIVDGITRDISEAYVTNCYTLSLGCNGGLCPHELWMAPQGAVYESDYPWTPELASGTSGTCGGPFTYYETIDSYATVPGANFLGMPPDANIKSAIYNYGPVWVDVCAASSAWSTYTDTSGIYTGNGLIFDHCVVLVGWCDSAAVSGGGYWILRNSWGQDWGINGYMYISYGSDVVGLYANYIVYKGGGNYQYLSSAEISDDKNILIYPNPAKDDITIESPLPAIIEISNNQGQFIKTLAIDGSKTAVDISGFASGMYFIKVKMEQGVAVKKFIKD